MKKLLIIALVILGSWLTEPGFTNSIGGFILLMAGLWGGYIDGKRDGIRDAFAGNTKFTK